MHYLLQVHTGILIIYIYKLLKQNKNLEERPTLRKTNKISKPKIKINHYLQLLHAGKQFYILEKNRRILI